MGSWENLAMADTILQEFSLWKTENYSRKGQVITLYLWASFSDIYDVGNIPTRIYLEPRNKKMYMKAFWTSLSHTKVKYITHIRFRTCSWISVWLSKYKPLMSLYKPRLPWINLHSFLCHSHCFLFFPLGVMWKMGSKDSGYFWFPSFSVLPL